MMTIIWSKKYELGISVIDSQHKCIVEYINQLRSLTDQKKDRRHLEELLYNLVDYTFSHLEFEEALLEEANYPEKTEHHICHDTFIRQIESFRKRFDCGEPVALELGDLLQDWLLSHILTEDMAYAPCVKKHIEQQHTEHHQGWVRKAVEQYFS